MKQNTSSFDNIILHNFSEIGFKLIQLKRNQHFASAIFVLKNTSTLIKLWPSINLAFYGKHGIFRLKLLAIFVESRTIPYIVPTTLLIGIISEKTGKKISHETDESWNQQFLRNLKNPKIFRSPTLFYPSKYLWTVSF